MKHCVTNFAVGWGSFITCKFEDELSDNGGGRARPRNGGRCSLSLCREGGGADAMRMRSYDGHPAGHTRARSYKNFGRSSFLAACGQSVCPLMDPGMVCTLCQDPFAILETFLKGNVGFLDMYNTRCTNRRHVKSIFYVK